MRSASESPRVVRSAVEPSMSVNMIVTGPSGRSFMSAPIARSPYPRSQERSGVDAKQLACHRTVYGHPEPFVLLEGRANQLYGTILILGPSSIEQHLAEPVPDLRRVDNVV